MTKQRFCKPEEVKEKMRLPYICSGNEFQKQMGIRSGLAGINARENAGYVKKQRGEKGGLAIRREKYPGQVDKERAWKKLSRFCKKYKERLEAGDEKKVRQREQLFEEARQVAEMYKDWECG